MFNKKKKYLITKKFFGDDFLYEISEFVGITNASTGTFGNNDFMIVPVAVYVSNNIASENTLSYQEIDSDGNLLIFSSIKEATNVFLSGPYKKHNDRTLNKWEQEKNIKNSKK